MKWYLFLLLAARLSAAGLESLTVEELRARAAKDDLPAKVEFAHRQFEGKIMPFDQKFVLETFRRGSEAGIARAHTGLADCHMGAVGMELDWEPVVGLLEKAVREGDPLGHFRLGWLLVRGIRMPRDEVRGMELIRKAGELGCPEAEAALARFTLSGEGVPQDVKAGLEKLDFLAKEKGNAEAAVILGQFHQGKLWKLEKHPARDPKLAREYYAKAAGMNHAGALVALGDIAMGNGGWKGDKQARQRAADFYRKAIARNSAVALRKLAVMQKRDKLVRKEGEDWYRMLLDADRAGDRDATIQLAAINYHAPGYVFRDLDWTKSAAFYEKFLAEDSGDFGNTYMAVNLLMEMYHSGGHGLERDFAKCIEIAKPHLDYHDRASTFVGRILLHPDLPMGDSREHIIRGYACMLKSREVGKKYRDQLHPVTDETLFILRSRHGMTREEVERAEEMLREGYPNPKTPILP